MAVMGIDLGGTKLASAVFSENGEILRRQLAPLEGRKGRDVGSLIVKEAQKLLSAGSDEPVRAICVVVPGIARRKRGTVWAPNIPGWEDYPLVNELRAALGDAIIVDIDSDRSAYIMGEAWRGAAQGSANAIFVAVGTGIGAGILMAGRVVRGHEDIAGAIGWTALDRPFRPEYVPCGCFEHHASGPGLVKIAIEELAKADATSSLAAQWKAGTLTTADVFAAYGANDPIAIRVMDNAIGFWGMGVANLVSLLNPEVIVFGGGVFGPASCFLDQIRTEAVRWGQPIAMQTVKLRMSELGQDAGLYGAGHLALEAAQGSNH